MRCQLTALLLLSALPLAAQTRADSALVARILTAEDRRDSASSVFAEGLASSNQQIRMIAARAQARIRDPKFASRDSLPAPVASPYYPDPEWRIRYRAIVPKPVDCPRIIAGLSDAVWAVRLRAADVMAVPCWDSTSSRTLHAWIDALPTAAKRARNGVSWQGAAHALLALSHVDPHEAQQSLARFATSPIPWVRVYAARTAADLNDQPALRRLAVDPNDNVKEAAIQGLARQAKHNADSVYIKALNARGYQVIRAAAIALKGTELHAEVSAAAKRSLARLRADSSETSIDARTALVDRLRELGDSSQSPELLKAPKPVPLGRDAVALALGKDVRLRVTLADSSGGGSFTVRLRGDVAPIMAARVLDLVRAGWYNDRVWYRIEPDFVIQGGGPGANEYVGHPRFMRDEVSSLPQVRGTVGMSTRGHDTGDAQWFVNLRDNKRLTRDYTSFGDVTEGIDVVDGILEGDVIKRIEVISPAARRR